MTHLIMPSFSIICYTWVCSKLNFTVDMKALSGAFSHVELPSPNQNPYEYKFLNILMGFLKLLEKHFKK